MAGVTNDRVTLPHSGGTGDTPGGIFHASDVDKLPGGCAAYHYDGDNLEAVLTGTYQDVLSVEFTPVSSRFYYVEGRCPVWTEEAGMVVTQAIADGTNAVLDYGQTHLAVIDEPIFAIATYFGTFTGGSPITVKLRAKWNGVGTPDVIWQDPAGGGMKPRLLVMDVGPTF